MENVLRFTARLPTGRSMTFQVNENATVRDGIDILEERLDFDPDVVRVQILRPDNNQPATLDTRMSDLILPQNRVLNEQVINIRYRRVIITEQKEPDDIEEMVGDGLLRDPKIDPPAVRRILQSIGPEVVQSIKLVRTPLSASTRFLLNVASFGQLNEKMKEADIDELFHLRMIINDKYSLEKNEVIRLYNSNKVESGSQVLPVNVSGQTTIQQMLDKTKERMGDLYGAYNAQTNNCGDFLFNVLSANGWITQEATNFTKQKTIELFKKFPSLTAKIVNLGTEAGAVASRVLEGEGACCCQQGGSIDEIEVSEIEDVPSPEEIVDQLNQQIGQLDNQLMPLIGQAWMDPTPALAQQIRTLQERITALTNERNNIIQQNIIQPIQDSDIQQVGTGHMKVYNFQLPECKIKF